jgi:hypothetical protein
MPTLIDGFLVLGPLVVVPLARPLLPDDRFPRPLIVFGAAALFAGAFCTTHRGWPALLALPWLAVALLALSRNAWAWCKAPRFAPDAFANLAAHGFLCVGAFFALASRAGWNPANVREPIVELTGVHFHYAGFGALVLALCVARSRFAARPGVAVALLLGMIAPPVVAAGFTWKQAAFQIGGAILMTAFTWTVAGLTLAYVVARVRGRPRVLLAISSLSVLAPMVLAIFWASAQYVDAPALSIEAMARVHGTMNAVGFVLCGLAGWRYAFFRSATTAAQRSGSLRYGA